MDGSRPLRLLSLDGGGVRGLSSLYILKYVMTQIESEQSSKERARPCDYFDMIAGTSTGGLIAIMLGVLEMDIDTCIDKYTEFSRQVFPSDKVRFQNSLMGRGYQFFTGKAMFRHEKLETIVKELVVTHAKRVLDGSQLDEKTLANLPMTHTEIRKSECKVFVCTTQRVQTAPVLIRSYTLPGAAGVSGLNCSIWEACRATTAAPFFFEPVKIGPHQAEYYDGAFNHNNPADQVRLEAQAVWGERSIGCLLSVGTGLQALEDVLRGPKILKTVAKKVTDIRGTHNDLSKAYLGQQTYYRFDVTQGLEKVGLSEAGKAEVIAQSTHAYMVSETNAVMSCVAQILRPSVSIAWPRYKACLVSRREKTIYERPQKAWTQLEELCFRSRPIHGSPRLIVIHGMAGVGKTVLCDKFASSHARKYWAIFRVSAGSPESLELGFQHIAEEIGRRNERNQLSNALSVLQKPWLLIVNDANTIVDLDHHVGLDSNATVLFTTRDRYFKSTEDRLQLSEMDTDEAINLILRRVPDWRSKLHDGALRNAVRPLVQEDLGCHPLAILQAGAIIARMRSSNQIESFRRYFTATSTSTSISGASKKLFTRMHSEEDYETAESVQKTFFMCFNEIDCIQRIGSDEEKIHARNALELIRFLAFIGPGVPLGYLTNASKKLSTNTASQRQRFPLEFLKTDGRHDPDALQYDVILPACAILDQFSLISETSTIPDEHVFDLHSVVRSCVLKEMVDTHLKQLYRASWLRTAHTLSCALAFNPDIHDERLQRQSVPHLAEFIRGVSLSEQISNFPKDAELDFIWLHFARILADHGHARLALRLQNDVLEYREAQGMPHWMSLQAKHDLAYSKRALGMQGEAMALRREILEKTAQMADIELPDNLQATVVESLAESLMDFGKNAEALEKQMTAIELLKPSAGEPRIKERFWSSQAKLATIHSKMQNHRQALVIREQVVENLQQLKLPRDRKMLHAMADLAQSFDQLGFGSKAMNLRRDILKRALENYENNQSHPDLLAAKLDYATSLDVFEDWEESLKLRNEVFQARLDFLGKHHLQTWEAMSNIGFHYGRRGLLELSRDWHEKSLRSAQGSQNEGFILQEQDELSWAEYRLLLRDLREERFAREILRARAEKLEKQLVGIIQAWESSFPDEYTTIYRARNRLLQLRFDMPDFFDRKQAQIDRQRLLEEQSDRKGERAEETLETQEKLARGYSRLYQTDDAVTLFRDVIKTRREIQGPLHPASLESMEYLAAVLIKRNKARSDFEESLGIHRELLLLYRKSRGDGHPILDRKKSKILELERMLNRDHDTEHSVDGVETDSESATSTISGYQSTTDSIAEQRLGRENAMGEKGEETNGCLGGEGTQEQDFA